MLREHATAFRRLTMFGDMCVVAVSFFAAYLLRDKLTNIYPLEAYLQLLPLVLLIWGILLNHFGMYLSFRVKDVPEVIYIVSKSAIAGFIIFGSLTYILKLEGISRGFISLVFLIAGYALCIVKILLLIFFRFARKQGLNYRNVLVVGTGDRAQNFIDLIRRNAEWGYRILGMVDEDPKRKGEVINGYKIIGSLEDIPDILNNEVVDEVAFVIPRSWLDRIEEAIHFCESQGVKVHLAVDFFNLKLARVRPTDLHGFPLLTFESTPDKVWHLILKRMLDILIAGSFIIILSPFLLILAVLIKLTSPGPVFFLQRRMGLNGRRFTLYKFRTMIQDAERKLDELMKYNEMTGPAFKMTNDPRLTSAGRFLREFSIDEFPQLWNVLIGHMSLVGPRPPLPREVAHYQSWQRRRLSMRPGITCLWQISGRNRITDFDEWMRLDLEYIDNWSLWLDFKILFQTVPAVLMRVGAK